MKRKQKTKGLRQNFSDYVVDSRSGAVTAFGERYAVYPIKMLLSIEDLAKHNVRESTAASFGEGEGRGGEMMMGSHTHPAR